MLFVLPSIFVGDTEMRCAYNFIALVINRKKKNEVL